MAAFLAAPPEVHSSDQTSDELGVEGAEDDSPWVASTVTVNDTVSHDNDRPTDLNTSWTQTAQTVPSNEQQQQNDIVATMGTLTINEPTHEPMKAGDERSVTATNAQLAQVLPTTYQGPPIPHGQNNITTAPQQSPVPHETHLTTPANEAVRAYQSIFFWTNRPSSKPHLLITQIFHLLRTHTIHQQGARGHKFHLVWTPE